ncbi:MAG: tRNA1(Val) (adenine(37)-N6)-methyltransferase [Thermodesulfovibrio sp.]|nr:tRNA1(Val) (adenine(37)-N6)-methyltransferase [Thermodesulfovibrio sp.]
MDYTIDSIGSIKIFQPKEGYRFSIDALILAHFFNLKRVQKVLDIGAGTGIIGTILAKRYPEANITMIEIQPKLAACAKETVRINSLEKNIRVLCMDARIFNESDFDAVVTNPPFRRPGSGKMSPFDNRAIARHEINLTVNDIAQISQRVLKHKGRLYMIHLPERLIEIVRVMSKNNLEIKRLRFVHSKLNTEAKIVLIEAVKGGKVSLKVEFPLIIYDDKGRYTEEIEKIYKI